MFKNMHTDKANIVQHKQNTHIVSITNVKNALYNVFI